MLKQAKNYILGKLVREVLADPVYKTWYCYKVTNKNNDSLISSVMCHEQKEIFETGLRQKVVLGEIVTFEIIAEGDEDEVTEEKYFTEQLLKTQLGLN